MAEAISSSDTFDGVADLVGAYIDFRRRTLRYYKLNTKKWGDKFWLSLLQNLTDRNIEPAPYVCFCFSHIKPFPFPNMLNSTVVMDSYISGASDRKQKALVALKIQSDYVAREMSSGKSLWSIVSSPTAPVNSGMRLALVCTSKEKLVTDELIEKASRFFKFYPEFCDLLMSSFSKEILCQLDLSGRKKKS